MRKYTLSNGITTVIKKNNNTPRTSIVLYSKINKDENKAGLYYLMSELLFQGTKNRTAEQIANELDENAIELSIEKRYDYIRFKIFCLNEDIDYAVELLQDIIENSTFDNYIKEAEKIKGEFTSDLDSAKLQAQEEYYKTIFKNHSYGTGRKDIINQINSITKEDLINAFNDLKFKAPKNISVVGDVAEDKIISILEKHLNCLKFENMDFERNRVEKISENRVAVVVKEDANQAQIYKGWVFPDIYSEDYPKILLLNTILGSCGLSSRLFLELREKQGLAYTVRSIFEANILGSIFTVYIATEPKNITTSINGFDKEINRIMTEVLTDEELESAKNSTIGRRQFYVETNLLEASLMGYYECLNLGYDFEQKLTQAIKSVTKEQILEISQKYFSTNTALCVLAPDKYLKEANLKK